MLSDSTTLVSQATPPGHGGVGVVRVCGPLAFAIGQHISQRKTFKLRFAHYGSFYANQQAIDTGLTLFFKGPHSFTGDDVVEFQAHGGPKVLDMLVQACLQQGAQLAPPGAFTQRAFLNGKMDLAQAEAVADLIHAKTEQAALAAQQSLQGAFSDKVKKLDAQVTHLRVYVEAAIDFAEEEIDFLSGEQITGQFQALRRAFNALAQKVSLAVTLSEGKTVAIIGAPNAGKSSLLNLWAGEQAAIVTHEPGTTRDTVTREVQLKGSVLKLIDTAGLRETQNAIEQEGIRRAKEELSRADKILCLHEKHLGQAPLEVTEALKGFESKTIHVVNKVDLTEKTPGMEEGVAYISAHTGAGFERFTDWLALQLGMEFQEGNFLARRRHLDALERCEQHLDNAQQFIATRTGELLAEELRLASLCLQEITGAYTSDDLLGKIFSSFCIGK